MRAVVVVRPEVPENTGFIARLCGNFGFELRLVEPGFNLEEARETASRAQEQLRDARIYSSLEEALEDLDYVIGTKPGRGVEAWDLEPRENTSLVIGPESSGLSNEELELCDAVAHIDTDEYGSVNQSHAAAIFMHSLRDPVEEGINQGQKHRLEQVLGDSLMLELLLRSSPSEAEANRLLGELEDIDA